MEENVSPEQPQIQVTVKRRFLNKRCRRLILIFIVLIFITLPSYYFYNQYQKSQALLQNSNETANIQAQNLIDKVKAMIELPASEQPGVYTVKDKTQLPLNPFFAKAENGDKVLTFSSVKKVILYRPGINKIIEVSVLNMEINNQPTKSSSSASPSLSPIVTAGPISDSTPTPIP